MIGQQNFMNQESQGKLRVVLEQNPTTLENDSFYRGTVISLLRKYD